MRTSARAKFSLLATGAVISLAAGLVAAPAATAATRPVDITGFSVKDMVFSSTGCKYNYVTALGKVAPSVDYFYADADVTRKGSLITTADFDEATDRTRILVCPGEGLGAYKIGPTNVYGETTSDYFDYLDGTTKTFYVRAKSIAGISTARKGKYVTVNVSAKYFKPTTGSYSYYNASGVKIQRKTTSGWTTIKTVNLSKGKASYRYYKSTKASYRAVVPQFTMTTAATSVTRAI